MTLLLVLPILIPLATACLGLLVHRRVHAQEALSVAGCVGLLAAAVMLLLEVREEGVIAVQMGRWAAPFGITLVADLLSAIMVAVAAVVGLASVVYSISSVDLGRKRYLYHPLIQVMLAGVCGAFLTGDIFNMYVWFEVLLLSSFVLMGLGGERAQVEGAIKYVTLNLLASLVFLCAAGVLYGTLGTLNMADLAVKAREATAEGRGGLMTVAGMMFMVAFGIKSAVFPVYFWLPASYHTPPFAVSALFAGLLTKVGVYALLRVFTLVFTGDTGYTHTVLLWVGAATMVSGVLGAASQSEFRRILSIHIVSQIGYMVLGLALFTPLAVAGAIFYMAHNILVKTTLFFVAGVADRLRGTSELYQDGRMGLYAKAPFLSALFIIGALSLAGIPPLSGFWAKLIVIRAGFEVEAYGFVAVAMLVGLMTLFSMTKIWAEVFWKSPKGAGDGAHGHADRHAGRNTDRNTGRHAGRARTPWTMMAPIVVMTVMALGMGLWAEPVFELCMRAAEQLINPDAYLEAVLGERGGVKSGVGEDASGGGSEGLDRGVLR